MEQENWRQRFDAEIEHAEAARNSGNEGMARVCARRAAGIVAGQYLHEHGIVTLEASAYNRLRVLQSTPGLPDPVYDVVGHFLVRITTDHKLPVEANLIDEARWLAITLLTSASDG